MPAAAQSKPVEGTDDAALAPGAGASHTVHLSFALDGLEKLHISQVHPSLGAGGAIPALAQSKPVEGAGNEALAPGAGASQTVHLSFTFDGFEQLHILHVHPSLGAGGAIPALVQSNPVGGADDEALAPGTGASHTVHLSFALDGLEQLHISHVQPSLGSGAFMPALAQSNPVGALDVLAEAMKLNDGRVSFLALAAATAAALDDVIELGSTTKSKLGSVDLRAACLALDGGEEGGET